MTESRSIELDVTLPASCERVFDSLITPSAIRVWWSARQAIVIPQVDGWWMATWGEDEDAPDYICGYRLAVLDRPSAIVFADPKYVDRKGQRPSSVS